MTSYDPEAYTTHLEGEQSRDDSLVPLVTKHEATIRNNRKMQSRNKLRHDKWAEYDEETRTEKDEKIAENEKYPWVDHDADEEIWRQKAELPEEEGEYTAQRPEPALHQVKARKHLKKHTKKA